MVDASVAFGDTERQTNPKTQEFSEKNQSKRQEMTTYEITN
jgi:hypothetical protein